MMRAGLFGVLVFAVALATTSWLPSSAMAQGPQSAAGAFSWNSTPAPDGRISMLVNLRTQRAYVYRGGIQIAATPISSGRHGYRTPTGIFTVLQKQKTHRSNKYHNARMPFMQRLAWDGLSLHAGRVPRHPSSHGCVHLPMHFARWLYSQPTMGMRVVITDPVEPEKAVRDASSIVAATDMGQRGTDSAE